MKQLKSFEIVSHILETADCWALNYNGMENLDDVLEITDGHYTGKGVVIRFEPRDGISTERDCAVFSSTGKYLGTRSDCWFNDINKNWYDKEQPIKV